MNEPVQLDLFAEASTAPRDEITEPARRIVATGLSDAALIAALSDASLDEAEALAAEAGRRRLGDAVEALAALCRRFAGFGLDRRVSEQIAALEALSAIGGANAARSVERLIVKQIVEGPNLAPAVVAAASLGVKFSSEAALPLLRHEDPGVRAAACGCVRGGGEVARALIALLADRDDEVATAAACALGRMGRAEARAALKRWLGEKPSPRVIEALAAVADEDSTVLLARLGRGRPDLAPCVLAALEDIEAPMAATAAKALAAWLSRPDRG
jgi:HEAT repeat protein